MANEALENMVWMMQQKLEETPRTRKDLKELLDFYDNYLHPKHYLNILAKRLTSQVLDIRDDLDIKLSLCKELVDVFGSLDPGVTLSRGLAYLEWTKALQALDIRDGKENDVILGNLEVVEKCLRMEPPDSTAGKIFRRFILRLEKS